MLGLDQRWFTWVAVVPSWLCWCRASRPCGTFWFAHRLGFFGVPKSHVFFGGVCVEKVWWRWWEEEFSTVFFFEKLKFLGDFFQEFSDWKPADFHHRYLSWCPKEATKRWINTSPSDSVLKGLTWWTWNEAFCPLAIWKLKGRKFGGKKIDVVLSSTGNIWKWESRRFQMDGSWFWLGDFSHFGDCNLSEIYFLLKTDKRALSGRARIDCTSRLFLIFVDLKHFQVLHPDCTSTNPEMIQFFKHKIHSRCRFLFTDIHWMECLHCFLLTEDWVAEVFRVSSFDSILSEQLEASPGNQSWAYVKIQ